MATDLDLDIILSLLEDGIILEGIEDEEAEEA
jgi:hypothetical protein